LLSGIFLYSYFYLLIEACGNSDSSFSTTAAFFDYDNEGDLDLYLEMNQFGPKPTPNGYWREIDPRSEVISDRLYENSSDPTSGHPLFRKVYSKAGIIRGGFPLGMLYVNKGDSTVLSNRNEK
jgi:hypothetical protein